MSSTTYALTNYAYNNVSLHDLFPVTCYAFYRIDGNKSTSLTIRINLANNINNSNNYNVLVNVHFDYGGSTGTYYPGQVTNVRWVVYNRTATYFDCCVVKGDGNNYSMDILFTVVYNTPTTPTITFNT